MVYAHGHAKAILGGRIAGTWWACREVESEEEGCR